MRMTKTHHYLERLMHWASCKGYSVEFSYNTENEVNLPYKEIKISTRLNLENRLYILLHECGHLLEYNNGGASYYKKYPLADKILKDARFAQSNQGRVETIKEEISAWNTGERLADRLGIKMNKKRYRKYAANKIITYIDWASDR